MRTWFLAVLAPVVLAAAGCGKNADIDAAEPTDVAAILSAVDDLSSMRVGVRSRAANVLREQPELARPHIRAVAADASASPVARALCVRLIGEYETLAPDDVELLCRLVRRGPEKVAEIATIALAEHNEQGLDCLLEGLRSGRSNDRSRFARLIAGVGSTAIDRLLAIAAEADADADPQTLLAVAEAIGRMDDVADHADRVAPLLLEILDHSWPQASAAASHALVRIGKPVVPELVVRARAADPDRSRIASETLGGMEDAARSEVLALTRDESAAIRAAGYQALGVWQAWDEAVLDVMSRALADTDRAARTEAINQVARHAGTEIKPIIPALFDLLADPDDGTRERAQDILVKIGPAVGHRLVRLLHHPNEWVVDSAISIARRLPAGADDCLETLDELAASGPESSRQRAAAAAKRIRRLAANADR